MSSFEALRTMALKKTFGKHVAVDSINFSFRKGQVHGFIGPNGAGKTTTMRMLATLELPCAGDAMVMGKSIVEEPNEVRRRIGFVPDWFSGFNSTTVHEYLDFFARACGLRGKAKTETVADIEDFTGLLPLRDKLITELSRGMQQRVTLGRSLVNNPDILLMDEPAANLDPRARIELRELVKALAERGKAILISSHILSELSEMCDSVTIIDKGRILVSGAIDEIKRSMKPHRTIHVKAACPPDSLERSLMEMPELINIAPDGSGFRFDLQGDDMKIASMLRMLVSSGVPVTEYKASKDGLEDIFMAITDTSNGKEG